MTSCAAKAKHGCAAGKRRSRNCPAGVSVWTRQKSGWPNWPRARSRPKKNWPTPLPRPKKSPSSARNSPKPSTPPKTAAASPPMLWPRPKPPFAPPATPSATPNVWLAKRARPAPAPRPAPKTPAQLLDTLRVDPDKMPDAEALDIDVQRLKRQREAMGAVNLRAEEDAKSVNDEYDTLAREKGDLEEAIKKLRSGIAGLNKEGR